MKNYKLLSFAALLALAACNVNSKTTSNTTDSLQHTDSAKTTGKALFVNMQIKDTINVGDSVLLKFTVHNPADSAQQFCKWHTPFEPLLSKYLEVKNETGAEANYRGAMAKRIVNYLKVGEYVSQGNEMGFIKFGSRVDVLLPVGTELNVALNQKVKGGITVLATIDTLVPVEEPNTGGSDSVAV